MKKSSGESVRRMNSDRSRSTEVRNSPTAGVLGNKVKDSRQFHHEQPTQRLQTLVLLVDEGWYYHVIVPGKNWDTSFYKGKTSADWGAAYKQAKEAAQYQVKKGFTLVQLDEVDYE